jgi:hypothetical protein
MKPRSILSVFGGPGLQASLVAVVALAVYLRTLAPTVMWYDMGEFATGAYVLGIAHNSGYPLMMLLGKLFTFLPFGDIAYRVNMLSAVSAAATVGLMYVFVFRITLKRSAAWIGALTLAVTSTFWSNATWAESYDLNAFLTLLILFALFQWLHNGNSGWLTVTGLGFGLGLANHRLILVCTIPFVVALWLKYKRKKFQISVGDLGMPLLGFILGFSVNMYLPIRAAQGTPLMWDDASDPLTFLHMVTTGVAKSSAFFNPFGSLDTVRIWFKMLTSFPAYELTPAGLILAAIGLVSLFRRQKVLLGMTAGVCLLAGVMVSVYGIHNIFNYYIPIYLVAILWMAVGCSSLLDWMVQGLAHRVPRVDVYLRPRQRFLLTLSLLLLVPAVLFRTNFGRLDRSHQRNAKFFADYLLDRVEPDAIILTDYWTWTPLVYDQLVEGRAPGVSLIPFFSFRDIDLDSAAQQLIDLGPPIYVSLRTEDVIGNSLGGYPLQLIAPYVVESMTTDVVPLPEFKDVLIPRGSVFRLLRTKDAAQAPEPAVPLDEPILYGEELELDGFGQSSETGSPGNTLSLSYAWRLRQPAASDYWADVLFTDDQGQVVTLQGFPVWLDSHWIGGGANPTSSWVSGDVVQETYDVLVPAGVQPGTYFIQLLIYKGGPRQDLVAPGQIGQAQDRVVLGRVIVR